MTSIPGLPGAQHASAGPGYAKTGRRQYQSCDQCRKSRRACDAGARRVVGFPLADDDAARLLPPSSTCDACSTCAKTGKRCTFKWLRALPMQDLPKGVKRKLALTEFPQPTLASGVPALPGTAPDFTLSLPRESTHAISQPTGPIPAATVAAAPPGTSASMQDPLDALLAGDAFLVNHGGVSSSRSSSSVPTESLPSHGLGHSGRQTAPSARQSRQTSSSVTNASELNSARPSPSTRASSCQNSNRSTLPPAAKWRPSVPLSPRQVQLADGATKAMIATGLLRIYHDSFENSLACWVTEANCPYEVELDHLVARQALTGGSAPAPANSSDNRIFSRVSRLDLAFARLRTRTLTRSESATATKALQAAVMAFASQWSHRSHDPCWRTQDMGPRTSSVVQSRHPHPHPPDTRSSQPAAPALSDQGERLIQRTLWHEARSAIQACAEIDSFKVILAYMLFALTQRPVDDHHTPPPVPSPPSDPDAQRPNHGHAPSRDCSQFEHPANLSVASDPSDDDPWEPFDENDVETDSSPPVYLETAVRSLFAWRRKLERYRRAQGQRHSTTGLDAARDIPVQDQQTFNLIFWLGVMCDTTSSVITKRPLVIQDEDCAVFQPEAPPSHLFGQIRQDSSPPHLPHNRPDDRAPPPEGQLWGRLLLHRAKMRHVIPRWPCSLGTAAAVLQEAIPVKVLMFRRVGQLQTLTDRNKAPELLETCIDEAITVYRQWNAVYGQFMLDCVTAHNTLPAHVQSWYVILDGHWHYGCLLLADAIDQVDQEFKTITERRELRSSCKLISELRLANAYAIARIAQVSLADHAPSSLDHRDMHFAFNGTAILTEPWTDILVRAMGSACKIFIKWLSLWDAPADPLHEWVVEHTAYEDLHAQANTCIEGMKVLGRKSAAANATADVFWNKLTRVCSQRDLSGQYAVEISLTEELFSQLPGPRSLARPKPVPTAG